MILRRLAVKRFRRFADYSIEFVPGLNVIYGPNEAGKSTLHDALLTGLFTKHNSRSAEIMAKKSWYSEGLPEITLEFESDGRVFSLAKDFEGKVVTLTNLGSGESGGDWTSADSIVRQAVGVNSASLFRATAFVGQDAMEAIASERDRRDVGDELQKMVTGGGEDVVASSVIRKFDDKIGQLQKGIQAYAKEPGAIRAARNRLSEIANRIAANQESLAKVGSAADALQADSEKLLELQAGLADRRNLLARCERRQQIEGVLAGHRQKEDELDQRIDEARSLQNVIRRAEVEMGAYGSLVDLDSTMLGRLASLDEAVRLWQQHDREIKQEIVDSEQARAAATAPRWLLLLGLILVPVGLAASIVDRYLLAASLAGLVLIPLYFGLRYLAQADHSADIRSAQGRLRYAQRCLTSAAEELEETLVRFSRPTYEELLRDYEAYRAIATRHGESKARLAGVLSGHSFRELERARRDASRERRDKEEMLEEPDLAGAGLDPLAVQRLTREVETFEAARDELQGAIMRNRVMVESSTISLVDVHRLEEEQSFWHSQLMAAERQLAVCEMARAAVEKAKSSVLISAKDVLEAEMGHYLKTITGGRYQRVSVDERTLSFAVYSPERTEDPLVDPRASLSRGAQDQLYLAARLSLAKLICGGKKPPLLFDDPFVTFDEARRDNTMRLCRELAREYQIILFTCDEAYRTWADNFIALPVP